MALALAISIVISIILGVLLILLHSERKTNEKRLTRDVKCLQKCRTIHFEDKNGNLIALKTQEMPELVNLNELRFYDGSLYKVTRSCEVYIQAEKVPEFKVKS